MPYALSSQTEQSQDTVLQLLTRLWQTKLRSISVCERWLGRTEDADVKAGLQRQLIDERRHLRMIGDEIKRLGGSIAMLARENRLGRPFALVLTQSSDLHRLSAFHRGIKVFTLNRCGYLIPHVDINLARTLEQIILDEERHIRWADMRMALVLRSETFSQVLNSDEVRQCKLLMEKVETMLEAAWPKPWLDIAHRRFVSVLKRRLNR
jgi:hypothetical protein